MCQLYKNRSIDLHCNGPLVSDWLKNEPIIFTVNSEDSSLVAFNPVLHYTYKLVVWFTLDLACQSND